MPHKVYFHGIPGSAQELSLLHSSGDAVSGAIFVPVRRDDIAKDGSERYFAGIAEQIETHFPQGSLHLTGFSLGAFIALQVAARLKHRVTKIDLVSPAAPLNLGSFLDDMAGKAVFQTALSSPRLFRLIVKMQSWAARVMPTILYKAIFASAAGQDSDLVADPDFRAGIVAILQHSLGQHPAIYQCEILFYVEDWSAILPMITQPVRIWQGDQDNWTPPAMADALEIALPNVVARHSLAGHSHYSTLRHYLARDFDIPINRA